MPKNDILQLIATAKRNIVAGIASGLSYDEVCLALKIMRAVLDDWLDRDRKFRYDCINAIEIGQRARRRLIRDESGLVWPYKPAKCTQPANTCSNCGVHPCLYTPDGLTPNGAFAEGLDLATLQGQALDYLRVGAKPLDVCTYVGISQFQLSAWRTHNPQFATAFIEAIGQGAVLPAERIPRLIRDLHTSAGRGPNGQFSKAVK